MDTKTPSTEDQRYHGPFHNGPRAISRRSARAVVPLLVKSVDPKSVIEIGSGEWLSAFRELGLSDLLRVDGAWATDTHADLPATAFHGHDLAQPLHLCRRFDLALCLGLAERLDVESAQSLVESLTRLAPVVAFSTVPPSQDGKRRLNEQWQSYWTDLFDAQEYEPFVALRHALWENDDVELSCRQTLICFCARNRPELIERLGELERDTRAPVDVVHPDLHLKISGDLARWRRSSERLEQRVRESSTEIHGLKSEIHRLRTEVQRLNNYAPLRVYRSLRRAMAGGSIRKNAEPRIAQERERSDAMTSLAKLIEDCPRFHAWPDGKPANWSVPADVLRFICDQVKPGMHTLETGAGQTTVAFALAGAQHITITPDGDQIQRINDYLRQSGIENRVAFVQGSSDTVLPNGQDIPQHLDFVFIDGAHRFPFPIIDWYYTEGRVPVGGIVAVDDCQMPSVRILHDFLAGEDDWELVQLIHVTAFFRRVRDTVNEWDWADQRINKPHLDMMARKSAPSTKDDPIARFLRKLI